MRMAARVHNTPEEHSTEVFSGAHSTSISIAPRPGRRGSSVSGGELLMLALATCYCNDVYREAAKMQVDIESLEVECSAEFPAEGAPASDVTFSVTLVSNAAEEKLRELAAQADRLAEIQNTVRAAIPVRLGEVRVERP
jgi:uncharacterized OsmC-like protein